MIFNQILIDQRTDILNHKSQNRHEVVVKVVDKFKLDWLDISS